MLDPIEHRDQVVAVGLADEDVALRVNLADGQLLVEGTEVKNYTTVNIMRLCREEVLTGDHERLDGVDNQDVVDVETGVTIVEREEAIDGELGA